jgi:hypothetical protein
MDVARSSGPVKAWPNMADPLVFAEKRLVVEQVG